MEIKTYEQIQEMKDGDQKKAWYELHFLNEELKKQGKKAVILKTGACYTYHIGVSIIDLNTTTSWYEDSRKRLFKNWSECFRYLEGMRDVFYIGLNK